MSGSDLHDRVHFASDARIMDRKDCLRAGRNRLFDLGFVEIQRVRTYINEDRFRTI